MLMLRCTSQRETVAMTMMSRMCSGASRNHSHVCSQERVLRVVAVVVMASVFMASAVMASARRVDNGMAHIVTWRPGPALGTHEISG